MSGSRRIHVERSTSTAHRLTHYQGACGNIHGHNIDWEISAWVSMENVGEDNMPVDFKDVADLIDDVDHACLLNEDDPVVTERTKGDNQQAARARDMLDTIFGDVVWFESDPTCEMVAKWMARRIYEEFEPITQVTVEAAETDKYTMEAQYPGLSEVSE